MDDEEELQEIRRRKLEELEQGPAQDDAQAEREQQAEQQRQAILRQILTPEARERLARLKIARAEFAKAVEDQLIMLAQSGQLRNVISDANLVDILTRLTPEKREIKITRR